MAENIDDATTVRALLLMAGVTPTEQEVDDLIGGFAGSRALIGSLYSMPAVRYEEPATIFSARP